MNFSINMLYNVLTMLNEKVIPENPTLDTDYSLLSRLYQKITHMSFGSLVFGRLSAAILDLEKAKPVSSPHPVDLITRWYRLLKNAKNSLPPLIASFWENMRHYHWTSTSLP